MSEQIETLNGFVSAGEELIARRGEWVIMLRVCEETAQLGVIPAGDSVAEMTVKQAEKVGRQLLKLAAQLKKRHA